MKRNGPSTVPWGAPMLVITTSEVTALDSDTLWLTSEVVCDPGCSFRVQGEAFTFKGRCSRIVECRRTSLAKVLMTRDVTGAGLWSPHFFCTGTMQEV